MRWLWKNVGGNKINYQKFEEWVTFREITQALQAKEPEKGSVGHMLQKGHGAKFPPGTKMAKPSCPECGAGKNKKGEQVHFVSCSKHSEWVKARHTTKNEGCGMGAGVGSPAVGTKIKMDGSPQGAAPNGKPYALSSVGNVELSNKEKKKSRK